MAKQPKSVFVCGECGYESTKWLGKCPACGAWNTFFEQKLETKTIEAKKQNKEISEPIALKDVASKEIRRLSTGFGELDRVLRRRASRWFANSFRRRTTVYGKSTLILQICDKVQTEDVVLYISGEESAEQIKIRADRLNISKNNILFLGETDIDLIEAEIEKKKPKLVIIDSIQTIYSDKVDSLPRKYKSAKRNNLKSNENVQRQKRNNNHNRTRNKRRKHSRTKSTRAHGRCSLISRRRKILRI